MKDDIEHDKNMAEKFVATVNSRPKRQATIIDQSNRRERTHLQSSVSPCWSSTLCDNQILHLVKEL